MARANGLLSALGRSIAATTDKAWLAIPAVAVSALLSVSPVDAQMSLDTAVVIASERDPGITALRHQIDRRSVEIEAARDERYPSFSLSADTATTAGDGPAVTLTVAQVLYDWGRVRSLVASASQDRIIAVSDLKAGVEELTLDVSNYFIDIEILDAKIARTRDYMVFAERIAGHAQARADAGRGDRGELARAQLEVVRTEERLSQLTSDRMLALSQIEFLLGRAPGRVAAPPALDFSGRYARSDAVVSAIRFAPGFIAAQAGVARAEAEVDLARASRMPTIKLQAQLRGDLNRGRTRSSVGLSTGVDVGRGALTGRQIQSARLQVEAARSNSQAIERNLANAVRSALERIRVLRASEASQANQLAQAGVVLDNYEEQFVGGQRQLLDLLTTGRDLYDAQMDQIDTYDERKRAEYRAAFDLGVLGTLIHAKSRRG